MNRESSNSLQLAGMVLLAAMTASQAGTTPPDLSAKPAAFVERLEAGEKITLVTMGTCRGDWPDGMMYAWLGRDYSGQVTYFNEGVEGAASGMLFAPPPRIGG